MLSSSKNVHSLWLVYYPLSKIIFLHLILGLTQNLEWEPRQQSFPYWSDILVLFYWHKCSLLFCDNNSCISSSHSWAHKGWNNIRKWWMIMSTHGTVLSPNPIAFFSDLYQTFYTVITPVLLCQTDWDRLLVNAFYCKMCTNQHACLIIWSWKEEQAKFSWVIIVSGSVWSG